MGCASSTVGGTEVNAVRASPDITAVKPIECGLRRGPSSGESFHQQYILKGKLGKGAFAQVHLARPVSRDKEVQEVAVKITDLSKSRRAAKDESDEADIDERAKRSVEREVCILRRVGAMPHCVGFHEEFFDGQLSYIVMERCDMTLLQALEHTPELTECTLARIIKEMLQALNNIHRLCVVHRDVKPDNFLCSGEKGTIKLCDFGLAAVVSGRKGELKGVYGTAPYMSPEMLGGHGYGAETDIWSLGIIAYVLLCGQFPYQPTESTAQAMKVAILVGTPQPNFQDMAGLYPSPAALAFLHMTLHRNRTARPSAADALRLQWVGAPAKSTWSAHSLRPALSAAKRVGAFDTRAAKDLKKTEMDRMLSALQAEHHGLPQHSGGSACQESGGGSPSGRKRSSKTNSERSLDSVYAARTHAGASPSPSHNSAATESWASYQSRHLPLAARNV